MSFLRTSGRWLSHAFVCFWLISLPATAQQLTAGASVVIPQLSAEPSLRDFAGMTPATELARQMARVDGFVQREPVDGSAPSQRTEVYLGYDSRTVYAIFLAFDHEPHLIRANLSSRENIDGDDAVELTIDTFNDQRTAYSFRVSPLGIQRDARWTENRNFDVTWDAAWQSDGELTPQGYMVRIAVPLASIRFPRVDQQVWRVQAGRIIPRTSEEVYWPAYSTRQQSRLAQSAVMTGITDVTPGGNNQFVPYVFAREADTLNPQLPGGPNMQRSSEFEAGLDAKFVFQDAWVLDLTLNPDFSQVESDMPQVTVNQRFEVQFPERRPFFIENADFFRPTDAQLLFTRRIVDPEGGMRFTGRQDGWGFGALLMNDQAPGLNRVEGDPMRGEKATIGAIRGFRDLGGQNRVGSMMLERRLADGHNRLAGIDGRFNLNANWSAVTSVYRSELEPIGGGASMTGVQRDLMLEHRGRAVFAHIHYINTDTDFRNQLGFQNRNYRADTKGVHTRFNYNLYPLDSRVITWGPRLGLAYLQDQSGVKIYTQVAPSMQVNFNTTRFNVSINETSETLRPQDFRGLLQTTVYDQREWGVQLVDETLRSLTFNLRYNAGTTLNLVPPPGALPNVADTSRVDLSVLWRPVQQLRVDNTFLQSSLDTKAGVSVFRNRIIRSSWNYQFTREISLRVIAQQEKTIAGPATRLSDSENVNFDVLLRYVINPLSAVYLGYNRNARNFDLIETGNGRELVPSDSLTKDGEQVFLKFSYLFQR